MDYFDFSTAIKILMGYMDKRKYKNQVQLMELFFKEFTNDTGFVFTSDQISCWLKRIRGLDMKLVNYYADRKNQQLFCRAIEERVLNQVNDPMMAAQTLKEMFENASNVSDDRKAELTEDTVIETNGEIADFIGALLCFAIAQPPWKSVKKNLGKWNSRDMQMRDVIYDTDVPNPCVWFQGRTKEMKQLHTKLKNKHHVFLCGIPGVGKSEMAKKYAEKYKKEYAKIYYISYNEDLQKTITQLSFSSDIPNEDSIVRFRRHNHFLRSLPEDVLLIIDNVNNTDDDSLRMVLDFPCRVLLTTRNHFRFKNDLLLKELDPKSLRQLAAYFFSGYEDHRKVVEKIIRTVHGHTFVVELAARLLDTGILDPETLLVRLRAEPIATDVSDEIRVYKDGKRQTATYYDHIRMLFQMFDLTEEMKTVMRHMALMPSTGIPAKLFAQWLSMRNLNAVNDLIETGLIQLSPETQIALHPIICEVSKSEFCPSVSSCVGLINVLYGICMARGLETPYHKWTFQAIERIMAHTEVDDAPLYFLFLEGAFWYMEKHRYDSGMKKTLNAMKDLLKDPSVGTEKNRALFLQCRCALEENTNAALKYLIKAADLIGEADADTAALAANLQNNIACCYQKGKLYEKARMHFEQGIRILKAFDLQETQDAIMQYINLANVLVQLGDAQTGGDILKRCKEYYEKENRMICDDYATVLYQLGIVMIHFAQYDNAEEYLQKALTIYKCIYETEPAVLEENRRLIDAALQEITKRTKRINP